MAIKWGKTEGNFTRSKCGQYAIKNQGGTYPSYTLYKILDENEQRERRNLIDEMAQRGQMTRGMLSHRISIDSGPTLKSMKHAAEKHKEKTYATS